MSELTIAGHRIGRIPSNLEMLPDEAPLEMPDQDFRRHAAHKARTRRGYWIPRAALFMGTLVLTAAFGHELYRVLGSEQLTPIQFLFLILSTIAFGWIALGSLSAGMGFLPLFIGERPDTIDLPPPDGALSTAHGAPFSRLSRGSRPDRRHRAGDRCRAAVDGAGRIVRHLHPVRHPRRRQRCRGGGCLWSAAAPPAGRHSGLLPAPAREPRAQVRQHQGVGAPLRVRLRALRRARRRQRHVRHDARAPDARHAARRARRPHPDRAAAHRRRNAAAAPAAVCLQRLRAVRRRRPRILASRPGQLLGPQRHRAHQGVRGRRRPAEVAGLGALRRRHPEPRLRRGRAAAARQLGRSHRADGRGLLRGPAADASRHHRPRPALGAGQSAASRHRARPRSDDDGPHPPADGRDVLSHLRGVGRLAARRRRAGAAGTAADPQLLHRQAHAVPGVAGGRSRRRVAAVLRHDADRADAEGPGASPRGQARAPHARALRHAARRRSAS